jgi:hypothetical protein
MSITWVKKQIQKRRFLEEEAPHKLAGFDDIKPLQVPLRELKKRRKR